jgi:hypothetical protein
MAMLADLGVWNDEPKLHIFQIPPGEHQWGVHTFEIKNACNYPIVAYARLEKPEPSEFVGALIEPGETAPLGLVVRVSSLPPQVAWIGSRPYLTGETRLMRATPPGVVVDKGSDLPGLREEAWQRYGVDRLNYQSGYSSETTRLALATCLP